MASSIDARAICLKRKPVPKSTIDGWKTVFPNLKLFAAIDGNAIDLKQDNRIHIMTRMFLTGKNKVANDSIFSVPSKGAVGCFLSHIELMKQCVANARPMVIIEQDAAFDKVAQKILPQAISQIPSGADYVSLMYIQQPHVRPYNKVFSRLVGPECDGNQCYYISPRGASIIVGLAFPMVTQIDLFIGIVSHVHESFHAFVLKTRLYSVWQMLSDNMCSSIQKFAIKKYLPRSNGFYYATIGCLLFLILYILHKW